MSTSSSLIKDEEIIREEVTEEVNKNAAAAKQALSQHNYKNRNQKFAESHIQSTIAETCDLTSVTGYEGTSLNEASKINRLRPKTAHPQVSGPNITNVSPSTYQKSLNKLQWALTNKDSFTESVEFWPKFNQTIYDKKGANFNLQKSKFNKDLKPRDGLMFCKDHSRIVIKQKQMIAKKYNQEVTRQYPREDIKFTTEKSTNWFKLYKNAVSLELTHPIKFDKSNKQRMESQCGQAERTFRREIMIQMVPKIIF